MTPALFLGLIGGVGLTELCILAVLVLLIFHRRLPGVARSIRDAAIELSHTIRQESANPPPEDDSTPRAGER